MAPGEQIWSVKKNEEAANKKKPKMSAAQLRVQKGTSMTRSVSRDTGSDGRTDRRSSELPQYDLGEKGAK